MTKSVSLIAIGLPKIVRWLIIDALRVSKAVREISMIRWSRIFAVVTSGVRC